MDRDRFIKLYTSETVKDVAEFVTEILLEYDKPIDKIQLLVNASLQIGLLYEVFLFLREKEKLKYNLTVLTDSQNKIIKVY